MATLEELTAQVAELQEQMDALTTPPSDYYVSQYSGEEIDAAISGGVRFDAAQSLTANQQHTAQKNIGTTWPCNPNLLDNWYFVGGGTEGKFPVNQRGQMSYSAAGYAIDRWYNRTANTKLETLENGLKIAQPVAASGSGKNQFINQRIENYASLLGNTVTLSFLIVENTLSKGGCIRLTAANAVYTNSFNLGSTNYTSGTGLYSVTVTLPNSINTSGLNVTFLLHDNNNIDEYFVVAAAKLELGDQQTLAHQDADGNWVLNEIPNYADQLARCQRYLVVYSITSTDNQLDVGGYVSDGLKRLYLSFQTPVPMRTKPGGTYSGKLVVRGTNGYPDEASYTTPYTAAVIKNIYENDNYVRMELVKSDLSTWSKLVNNTPVIVQFLQDTTITLSAEL